MRTVIGLLDDLDEAGRTARELRSLGLSPKRISIVSRAAAAGTSVDQVALSPVNIAGLGQVAAGGPMVQFLTPETAQTHPDALVGTLVRMGLSQSEAARYVEGVRNGYTLEAAIVEDDQAPKALEIMKQHAHDERRERETARGAAGAPGRPGIPTGRMQEGEAKVPVVEEEMVLGKREVPATGVRVSTHVIETPVAEEITLREEHIDVQHRRVDRDIAPRDEANMFRDQTIEVTATAEEPVVGKHSRVVEEVVVTKDVESHDETVRDTVRRTDVTVEDIPPFEAAQYQEHFRQSQAKAGGGERHGFETYEPAYRFGHELRGEHRQGKRDWNQVEADARAKWEKRSPGTWERFKDAIKHAFGRSSR